MLRKYPALFLLLVIIPGIVLGDTLKLTAWIYLLPAGVACLAGLFWLERHSLNRATLAFGVGLLFFSAFHFNITTQPTGPHHVAHFADSTRWYHLFGQVVDWPELRTDRTEIKVELDSIGLDYNWPASGKVMIKLSDTTTSIQRGDYLEFYGRIYPMRGKSLPGGFDYQRFLSLKGIYGIVYMPTLLDLRIDTRNRYSMIALVDRIREYITDCFQRNLSPEGASLAAGFLIGETRNIPTRIYKRFRDTGTLHLLAVSGSNVALVLGFIIMLLRPLGLSRRVRAIVLMIVLILFTLLSYGEPSVIRASVMAGLVIIASVLERRYDLNNIIALAAVIILLFDPAQLYDVGFQLSFVTAWGLIFFTPIIYRRFMPYAHRKWYRFIIFPLIISLIAQICSMPLIALYFQKVPVISVLANLVIVPLVSVAVIGILCLLVADIILPLLGMFVGSFVNILLSLVISALNLFGSERIPIINTGHISFLLVILFYLFLMLLVWSVRSKPIRRAIIIGVVLLLNGLAVQQVIGSLRSENKIDVWFISVPGGMAVIVKPGHSSQGDLIITGIADRDYPIDERVLLPALDRLGIEKLGEMFLLSGEFNAIKDVLGVAKRKSASQLVIPSSMKNSVQDVISLSNGNTKPPRIIIADKLTSPHETPGYYPFADGVMIVIAKKKIIVVDRCIPSEIEKYSFAQPYTLAIGQKVKADSPYWALLNNYNHSLIICSKIIQPKDYKTRFVKNDKKAVPDYVIDLSQKGSFRLQIPFF